MADLLVKNIDQISKGRRLQRKFMWSLILPADISGISGIEVSKHCQSMKFGDYSITTISTIRYGGFVKGYAGFFDIENAQAEFLNPIPDIVSAYFLGWRKLIMNDQGLYYPKMNYAKTIYVQMYDRDGSVSAKYKLTGVFPKTYPKVDLDYSTDDIHKFNIEFHVDRVYKEI